MASGVAPAAFLEPAPRVERFRPAGGPELVLDRYRRRGGAADVAVVVSHGIFAHRRLPELCTLARLLARRFDVVTLDCRGHGDSGGRFSFGLSEWEDLRDLAASLRPAYRFVAGVGFSFGAFHTCLAAALGRAFDAVSLVAGPKSLNILDHNFFRRGFLPSMQLAWRRERRRTRLGVRLGQRRTPIEVVDQIAVPVHFVHGEDDWLVHPEHSIALHQRARAPKQLDLLPGGVHAEYLVHQMPERLVPLLEGWIDRWSAA